MHSIFEILDESTESAGPDLVSLDDLKFALGITGTSEDDALQAAITFQSRIISEYCDRRFGLAEALETFTFDSNDRMLTRQALTLRLYPVVEVHEISTAGATGTDYDFDPETGRLWSEVGSWQDAVSVIYSGGYDLPEEAPARLQKAVIEAIFETRSMGGRDPSIRSVAHGDTNISYFTSATATANSGFLSAPVLDLIRPFRRLQAA
jgi:hypothetical protein